MEPVTKRILVLMIIRTNPPSRGSRIIGECCRHEDEKQ